MVLRTIPAVLKKGNRKMVVNTPLILIKRASAAVTSRRIKWAQWNTIDNACSNGIKVNGLHYQSQNKCIHSQSSNESN